MKSRNGCYWVGSAAVIVLAVTLSLSKTNEYFFFAGFVVLQFVVLATAWNILAGYAGYVNFGTAAFFGLGAYTAVVVISVSGAPLALQILAAATVGGLVGLGTGLLTLRLRGIFFSIATVAIVFVAETFIDNWRYVGGATGMYLSRPTVTGPFDTYTRMLFVVMVMLAIIAVSVARYIEMSWIGRGLRAIRDAEEAAECSGVPTVKLKVFACTVSGALMGAAGAPLPMYLGFIEPTSSFSLNYSIAALAAAIIGGTSRWIGPVIGAIVLASMQQIVTVTISSEINVLVVGVLLVVFVVAAPDGILSLVMKLKRSRALAQKSK
jgi:branched-chain amino acid transport system permease protein